MLFDCLLRVCGTKVCWNTSLDISYSGFGWSGHGNHLNCKNKCIIVTVWVVLGWPDSIGRGQAKSTWIGVRNNNLLLLTF